MSTRDTANKNKNVEKQNYTSITPLISLFPQKDRKRGKRNKLGSAKQVVQQY